MLLLISIVQLSKVSTGVYHFLGPLLHILFIFYFLVHFSIYLQIKWMSVYWSQMCIQATIYSKKWKHWNLLWYSHILYVSLNQFLGLLAT